MGDPSADALQTPTTRCQWEQIALQLELLEPASKTEATSAEKPSLAIQEALKAADHAREALAQREVLTRVYAHLAEQAAARGRAPVPKAQKQNGSPGTES